VLWDKASLVSVDEIREFYVRELQPFVSMLDVRRQLDNLRDESVTTKVQDTLDTHNVTLYGSTQLAVDLAELAAEAGNVTLAIDSAECTQSQTTAKGLTEQLTVADEHSKEKAAPEDVSIALDGFCLQSSSVSVRFLAYFKQYTTYGYQ